MPARHLVHPAGTWYDPAPAQLAVEFFGELLKHTKAEWAGRPLVLEPWQEWDVVRPLFGWRRADGTRQYRTVFVEVPRKNGKSTLAAGIALLLTFSDGEPGAEVYSAAVDRGQAAIVFDQAKAMVRAEPALARRAQLFRTSLVVPATGSSYKVLSADVPTKHGLNAHGVIIDEVHAHRTRDLVDVLVTSQGARRQPVLFAITTAGYDRTSVCWELHAHARAVLDGVLEDPAILPVIYAADPDDDWTDARVWAKANPGLGVTLKPDYLERECRRAQESPAYQNTFRRLHLNQWTQQEDRWIDVALWDANAGVVDPAALAHRPCTAGLDLSTTTDVSAFVLLFRAPDGSYDVLPFFWIPGEKLLERVRRDGVPFDAWVRDGFVAATPGPTVDYDVLRRDIGALGRRYRVESIMVDPWNATQLATQLQRDGFTMLEFRQGFRSMTAPTKELMTLLLGHRLRHGGHPVLRWMAANVAVQQDPAGNLKPDKAKSTGRIDGIVALIGALDRAIRIGGEAARRWLIPDQAEPGGVSSP